MCRPFAGKRAPTPLAEADCGDLGSVFDSDPKAVEEWLAPLSSECASVEAAPTLVGARLPAKTVLQPIEMCLMYRPLAGKRAPTPLAEADCVDPGIAFRFGPKAVEEWRAPQSSECASVEAAPTLVGARLPAKTVLQPTEMCRMCRRFAGKRASTPSAEANAAASVKLHAGFGASADAASEHEHQRAEHSV
jgi:hypothetical protein